jgi:opacity protein-like surface antigen
MWNKKLLLALGGMAAFSLSASSMAAGYFPMSYPNGWYGEINGGSVRLSGANYGSGISQSSSGIGGNVNLGYKFMPYAAMEIGYSSYPYTKLSYLDVNLGKVSHYSYDIAAKGIVPLSDSGFEVFAKLGAVHLQSKFRPSSNTSSFLSTSSASKTGLYLGVGGQVNIWPELGVNVQWQRAQGNSSTGTENLFSAGIAFIFV